MKNIKSKELRIPQDIIDEYLETDFIDEENYDLENATLYEYGEGDSWRGTLELQAFSNKRLRGIYFWIKSDDTEETYKGKKIAKIKTEVEKKCNELYEKINSLTSEFKQYSKFKGLLSREESEKKSEIPIPKTVDEAVKTLGKIVSKEDRDYLLENGAISMHNSLGRWIRNEWGLWTDSELKNELKSKGFEHPDDMSNYIIEEFIKYWNNKV